MTLIEQMERAIAAANRDLCIRFNDAMYSDPNSFVGPMPAWRTHVTHRDEWELDGGGPGQYWIPRRGTKSWEQELARGGWPVGRLP